MKTKYLFLIAITFLTLMPIHLDAQEKKDLREVSSFTGEITQWLHNASYIYNAFELKVSDKLYVVEFPTTLGTRIQAIGNNVTVNGIIKESKKYSEEVIDMVSIEGDGNIIYKNEEKGLWSMSSDEFKTGKGKVTTQQINERGKIIAFIVDEHTVLRIPSQFSEQLSQMIESDQTVIEYTGMEKKLEEGEITENKFQIVNCQTITINGKQYIVDKYF